MARFFTDRFVSTLLCYVPLAFLASLCLCFFPTTCCVWLISEIFSLTSRLLFCYLLHLSMSFCNLLRFSAFSCVFLRLSGSLLVFACLSVTFYVLLLLCAFLSIFPAPKQKKNAQVGRFLMVWLPYRFWDIPRPKLR